MNVVIMQPHYLFLRKHFHQIYRADIYVFYDDVQFVKNYHHNRNRIKNPKGYTWLTVPVLHKGRSRQLIKDVEINSRIRWGKKHWQSIQYNYSRAPYFKNYRDFFEQCYSQRWDSLSELNIFLIKSIAQLLGITNVSFVRSSELGIQNSNPTQRLIDICKYLGASRYIIGISAKKYMEEKKWAETEIRLEWFEPQYPPYPQLWEGFLDNCSILDLLFNCGPESYKYIWGDIFQNFQKTVSQNI